MIWVVIAGVQPLPITYLLQGAYRRLNRPFAFYPGWMGGALFGAVAYVAMGSPGCAVAEAANVPVAVFLWWLSRRRRKRAPKLAGYKARAFIAALVRKAREAVKSRPVLRPAPGGAR